MPLDQVIGSRDGDSLFLFLGSGGGGKEEEREGAGEVRFVEVVLRAFEIERDEAFADM